MRSRSAAEAWEFLTQVFSHSGLSSFENCPRQFAYRYIEKIPVETESIEAFVGKRVHEVLERLYRFLAEGRLPGIHAVLNRFRTLWEEQFDPARVRIVRTGTPTGFYLRLGERCLENYYRRHYPFDADQTLGLEEAVQFELDTEGRYRMRGIVDRVARAADGAVEIHDYKTGQRVPPQRVLDTDRQLALYQIGVAERHGEATEYRLVWHYVASGQTRVSRRTAEQLDGLRRETMELIDSIHAEASFEPRPGPLCSWCEYNARCPAYAGNAGIGGAAGASDLPTAPPPPRGQISLL